MNALILLILLILTVATICTLVWCARHAMASLRMRMLQAAHFEEQTMAMLQVLIRTNKELIEIWTEPDGERMVKVPLKAVIAAIRRLDTPDGTKLVETTYERNARIKKENEEFRKRQSENGFIYTIVQDELEDMKNGQA